MKTLFYLFIATAIILAGLKLSGSIALSWWWVLAPIWAPFILLLIVVIVVAIALKNEYKDV